MKLLRRILLICTGFALALYVAGVVCNVFDLVGMRSSDAEILASMSRIAAGKAFLDTVAYENGVVMYAGIHQEGGDRDAVFFVHGSPGALDAFMPYLTDTALLHVANLYSLDRPGYGGTQPLEAEGDLEAQSAALHAVVSRAGAKRNYFVGHSLGCTIIARFAADYPELTDGLVMVAAAIDPDLEPGNWWRYLLETPVIRMAMPRVFTTSNRELFCLKRELREAEPLWPAINCPVIFIHGARDRLVPVENVKYGTAQFTNADVSTDILDDEGHFILWTHLRRISGHIQGLIAQD